MVLNQLKQIRAELKNSADAYDSAFKNTALIAAEELVNQEKKINDQPSQRCLNPTSNQHCSNQSLDKEYFIAKYGSLKQAKAEYQMIYGKQKYGRSWSDFIAVANQLSSSKLIKLTLEQRVTKIENFLSRFGYQL